MLLESRVLLFKFNYKFYFYLSLYLFVVYYEFRIIQHSLNKPPRYKEKKIIYLLKVNFI